MKRKLLACVLACTMAASLAGCGSSASQTASESKPAETRRRAEPGRGQHTGRRITTEAKRELE
ncbi:MAG: hypothetical protein ACLR0F_22920 [Eisenbergiella sp.]